MKTVKQEERLENLKRDLQDFIEVSDQDKFIEVDKLVETLDMADLAKSVGCEIVGQGMETYRDLSCATFFLKPDNNERCNYLVVHLTKTAIIVDRLY